MSADAKKDILKAVHDSKVQQADKGEWDIPLKWFLDYCDSFPEDSKARYILNEMHHNYLRHLQQKRKEQP